MTDAEAKRRTRAGPAHGRTRRERRTPGPFYAEALAAAERDDLLAAAAVRGLEQEIALLRLWLRRILIDRPDDFGTAEKAVTLLVRAVSAAGRLPDADGDDLVERVSAELNEVLAALAGEPGE
jgi:hypothetical protein